MDMRLFFCSVIGVLKGNGIVTSGDYRLSKFIYKQKNLYAEGKLTDSEVRQLEALGIDKFEKVNSRSVV